MIVKGRRKEMQRPVKVCGLIQQQWACASGRRGTGTEPPGTINARTATTAAWSVSLRRPGWPPGSPKHACVEMFEPAPACGIVNRSGMALQLYAIYARCNHCGIYDRNPQWCVLCGRAKDGSAGTAPVPPVRLEAKRTAPKSRPAKKKRPEPRARTKAKAVKPRSSTKKRRVLPAKTKPKPKQLKSHSPKKRPLLPAKAKSKAKKSPPPRQKGRVPPAARAPKKKTRRR